MVYWDFLSFFFIFLDGKVGLIGVCKGGTAPRLSWVQGPPFVLRARIRDAFDHTASWGELLFCHHVFSAIHINLVTSHFLEMWISWRPGGLVLALCRASVHAHCSAAWCGWMLRLGQSGPWPLCPGGFQRHCMCQSGAQTGDSMPVMKVHWQGLSPRSLRETCTGSGCIHYWGGCCS